MILMTTSPKLGHNTGREDLDCYYCEGIKTKHYDKRWRTRVNRASGQR